MVWCVDQCNSAVYAICLQRFQAPVFECAGRQINHMLYIWVSNRFMSGHVRTAIAGRLWDLR